MDTREKIIEPGEVAGALKKGSWVVVAGEFDPLTAEQAQRLTGLADGKQLLVVVLERDAALLPAPARAALLAGLRSVTNVVIAGPHEWARFVPGAAGAEIYADEAAERERSDRFIRFILQRQETAAVPAGKES